MYQNGRGGSGGGGAGQGPSSSSSSSDSETETASEGGSVTDSAIETDDEFMNLDFNNNDIPMVNHVMEKEKDALERLEDAMEYCNKVMLGR